jgi:hypothetical protein
MIIIGVCIMSSCDEEEILAGEDFYENYYIDRLSMIMPDRNLFLEGAEPIQLDVDVEGIERTADGSSLTTTVTKLENVVISYEVDGMPIDGDSFTPQSTGTFSIIARTVNNISSLPLEIEAILAADFDSVIGFSDRFIRVESSQSSFIVGDEIDISVSLSEEFLAQSFPSNQVNLVINGMEIDGNSFSPTESGVYEIYGRHMSGVTSNIIEVQVR